MNQRTRERTAGAWRADEGGQTRLKSILYRIICGIALGVGHDVFGLGDDGHFKAYIPATWQFLQFDTGLNPDDPTTYGHLIIKW